MVEQENITEDEAALYDRQIRLWGLDAQRRLRAARVLLVGVSGLGGEVAKNIVLSGINSLTLLDSSEVTEEDACSQFLVKRADVGKNRANCSLPGTEKLNPMVTVTADASNIADKTEEFFTQFDVICTTNVSEAEMVRINEICHKNKIQYFAGDVYGYFGFMFSDLGEHDYVVETLKVKKKEEAGDGEPVEKKQKTEEKETVIVKHTETFSRLKDALDVDWKEENNSKKVKKTPSAYFLLQVILKFIDVEGRKPLASKKAEDCERLLKMKTELTDKLGINEDLIPDQFFSHCFAQLSPVCAIVGGVLGQEIIKAVSKKDPPHNNFFFYNGIEGSGLVDKITS